MKFSANETLANWASSEDLSWLGEHELLFGTQAMNKAVFNCKTSTILAEFAIWGRHGTYSLTAVESETNRVILNSNRSADDETQVRAILSHGLSVIRQIELTEGTEHLKK
jgi:hypothetical protein